MGVRGFGAFRGLGFVFCCAAFVFGIWGLRVLGLLGLHPDFAGSSPQTRSAQLGTSTL